MVKRKGDQTEEAVNRMESLGLPSKFVRNIIRKSLKLYGGWEFLQAENYQVLADLCFEEMAADRLNAKSGVSFRCDLVGTSTSPSKGKAKMSDSVEPIQTVDPSASRRPLESFLGVGLRRLTTPCPFEEDVAEDSPQVPEAHSSHPSNDDSSSNKQIILFTEDPKIPPENQSIEAPENQWNEEATPPKLGIAFVKANPRALMLIAGNYFDDDEDE